MIRQETGRVSFETRRRGLFPIGDPVASWLAQHGARDGLLTLFIEHTSASLLVQENAGADVLEDLERFFARLVPDGDKLYRHTDEGPDDMPAHVRAALTQTSIAIPVRDGKLGLGTWQGVFIYEHRLRPKTRTVALHYVGI